MNNMIAAMTVFGLSNIERLIIEHLQDRASRKIHRLKRNERYRN